MKKNEDSGADKKQNKGSDVPDRQYHIALIFILGFFIFIGLALGQFFITADSEALKLIGTLFGGWVGTIIGFYFGQKPVEQVKKELRVQRKINEKLTADIQSNANKLWEQIEKQGGTKGGCIPPKEDKQGADAK